jgi:hypothetical protein
MPWQKVQAGGTTVEPATTTINFANATATKSGDTTTITVGSDTMAGAGLTNTSGVLAVGAGNGITVNANDVALASSAGGAGLTYTSGVLAVGAGTAITVNADDVAVSAASLSGTQVATTANANVIGGIPVLHRINVADGATGDVDTVLTHKTLVTEVWLVKTSAAGGASDTITVKNGSTAITNDMDINVADKTVVRAGTIDDAQHEVAAAGTLKITRTKSSMNNVACTVYVMGLRVA